MKDRLVENATGSEQALNFPVRGGRYTIFLKVTVNRTACRNIPERGGWRAVGHCRLVAGLLALTIWATVNGSVEAFFPFSKSDKGLEEVIQTPVAPAGMTITPEGDYIISCHQFYPGSNYKVIRFDQKEARWVPFPNLEMNTGQARTNIDAVLGLECDEDGIVWMLDNGRDGEKAPKLIAWDTAIDDFHKVIPIQESALVETSFLNDLALDPEEKFIYISDPASGSDAALIVVDLRTNECRRLFSGTMYVQPTPGVELVMEAGKKIGMKKPDGTVEQAMRGVNPIAVDRKGNWLYFGAMNSDTLFRVPTRELRDRKLKQSNDYSIEQYGRKPICDSISIDSKGNIYFGDIQSGAITVDVAGAKATEKYQLLVDDGRIAWPDGLCFGTDGKLHFFCSQLHLSDVYNGKSAPAAPFQIFKIRARAEGMVGR